MFFEKNRKLPATLQPKVEKMAKIRTKRRLQGNLKYPATL